MKLVNLFTNLSIAIVSMQTIALSCCPIAHKLLSDWYQSDTLPVFCTGKAVLAIKWGISAMKWGIFALYAPHLHVYTLFTYILHFLPALH